MVCPLFVIDEVGLRYQFHIYESMMASVRKLDYRELFFPQLSSFISFSFFFFILLKL